MAGMTWSDKRLREPLEGPRARTAFRMDIAPDVAMAIAELTPRARVSRTPRTFPWRSCQALADRRRHDHRQRRHHRRWSDPTGAGKTTTIAKLAARWCMLHGSKDLALVSTDAYRIGAREQLMTYARILDAPMYPANSAKELGRLLERA
jgi:flagellar biosynthesis protein FlhF